MIENKPFDIGSLVKNIDENKGDKGGNKIDAEKIINKICLYFNIDKDTAREIVIKDKNTKRLKNIINKSKINNRIDIKKEYKKQKSENLPKRPMCA